MIFQTHYPYEGNNLKRFHVLIFLGRITILPSEETFAPMFERLRTFHQEFMAQTRQDGFTGLVSSDDNIQSRLFDMSPSSFIRGKFSDVKYMFEEAKLLFTNFYFSRKANNFDDSSFIYDFQSFSIDFPSEIWL